MMNFWDTVYGLREQGDIPRMWTKSCLLPHCQPTWDESLIDFVVSDNSASRNGKQAGRNLKFGFHPKAWRIGQGWFQLVVDPADDAATQEAERQRAAELAERLTDPDADPYPLRGHPYRWDDPLASTFDMLVQEELESRLGNRPHGPRGAAAFQSPAAAGELVGVATNFWDKVYELREQGDIPRAWTKSGLLPHCLPTWDDGLIDFVVSGNSASRDGKQAGRNLQFGFPPQAWRIDRGRFQLVVDPADNTATQESERQRAAELAELLTDPDADPYPLRGHPYRWDDPLASTFDMLVQEALEARQ